MDRGFCTHQSVPEPLLYFAHKNPPDCKRVGPLLNALQAIWEKLGEKTSKKTAQFWIRFETDPDFPAGRCEEKGLTINLARIESGESGVQMLAFRLAHELSHLHRQLVRGIEPILIQTGPDSHNYSEEEERVVDAEVFELTKTEAWYDVLLGVSAYLQQQGSG